MRKFIRRTNRILVYIKTANICSTSSLFSSSRLSCFLHGSILLRTLHKKNFKLLEKDKFFCDQYQISLQKRTQKLEKILLFTEKTTERKVENFTSGNRRESFIILLNNLYGAYLAPLQLPFKRLSAAKQGSVSKKKNYQLSLDI